MSDRVRTLVGTARLPFTLLTPACLMPGYALAVFDGFSISYLDLALILFAGLAAHISVNVYNEYFDFKSGLDLDTERTLYSGGSGALPSRPQYAQQALLLAHLSLMLLVLTGFYFIYLHGWKIAPLGLFGILIILTYTNFITRHPWLCLFAPGVGFGPLLTIGTYFALTGHYSLTVAAASLVLLFFINNILLLNQYPDIDADRDYGRNNVLINYGVDMGRKIFYSFYLLGYLILLLLVLIDMLPVQALVGLITIPIAFKAAHILHRERRYSEKLLPAMAMNILVNLLTPMLIGLGIIWAAP